MEVRVLLEVALESARDTIVAVGKEYEEAFGRSCGGMLWEYRAEDAEVILVAAGSLASEASMAVDALRETGIAAGVVGVRVYRPFPKEELREALRDARLVLVFDKSLSYGNEGPICTDLKAALYGSESMPPVQGHIAGLGGRDIKAREIEAATRKALQNLEAGITTKPTEWLNCHI